MYDIFKENNEITVLHCMAHGRRKFFEAKENNPSVAEHALEQIGLLYAIERKAKEQQLKEYLSKLIRKLISIENKEY